MELVGARDATRVSLNESYPRVVITSRDNGITADDEDGLYEIPNWLVTLLIISYITVSLTAALGNGMILFVIGRSRRLRSVTNLFIANLATADIIIAVFAIPFQFQAALLQRWVLPVFMCSFCPTVQVVSLNVSIFTLVAISVDRYRAVINPLEAYNNSKLRTKGTIGFIWLFSVFLAIPTFMGLKVQYIKEPSTGLMTKPFCNMIGMDIEIWKVYNFGLVSLQYIFPLAVITYAYSTMGYRLCRETGLAIDARCNSDRIIKNKKKVIKMLFIVILLFAVCWLPFQSYNFLQELYPSINEYKYINIIWFSFHLLAMSNSCYNPIIYYVYSELYNAALKNYFGWIFCRMCCVPTSTATDGSMNSAMTNMTNNNLANGNQKTRSVVALRGKNITESCMSTSPSSHHESPLIANCSAPHYDTQHVSNGIKL